MRKIDIKRRFRLWRMERALRVHLTPEQREMVLCPDRPSITGDRKSGKTLTACMWLLYHRKNPLIIRNVLNEYSRDLRYQNPLSHGFLIPDPDVKNRNTATHCMCYLLDKWEKCKRAKIQVFDVYSTYEKYLEAKKEEKN